VVALHRLVDLSRSEPASRLLLTTRSAPLAALLLDKLNRLIADQPTLAERLDVLSMRQLMGKGRLPAMFPAEQQ